jgi:glycosyltransferase involved in cell wall biosynthesis
LLWDFHLQAFSAVRVTLIGHNPELEGVAPSRDWADLKEVLARHRFFVHTADPKLEDGYNTATLEAMAAGLPVLGNPNPSSPITHGADGFLSDNPVMLANYAKILLEDRGLAEKMGRAARRTVQQRFSPAAFVAGFERSITEAQAKARLIGKLEGVR